MTTRLKSAIAFALITVVFICPASVRAQIPAQQSLHLKQKIVRINFLGLAGFGFEQGLGRNWTLRPEAGLGAPVFIKDEAASIKMESLWNPYLLIEARYYYNLQRRARLGRPTANFSANYIAPFFRYNVYQYEGSRGAEDRRDSLLKDVQYVGVWWGIQRNLGPARRFYVSASLGPGIKTNMMDYLNFAVSAQLGAGIQW